MSSLPAKAAEAAAKTIDDYIRMFPKAVQSQLRDVRRAIAKG